MNSETLLKPETLPIPPTDLKERCRETIPASAVRRQAAPRLFPDAGSRTRLGWLSVAAAIPVVAVLAVLPLRKYLTATHQVKAGEIAPTERYFYIRAASWSYYIDFQNKKVDFHQVTGRYFVYDSKVGSYSADQNIVSLDGRDYYPDKARWSRLETAKDTSFDREKEGVRAAKLQPGYWKKRVVQAEKSTRAAFSSPEKAATGMINDVCRNNKASTYFKLESNRPVDWQGQPARLLIYKNWLTPEDKRSAANLRAEVTLDRTSNLPINVAILATWDYGPAKGKGDEPVGGAKFYYTPNPEDDTVLKPETIKQGATVVGVSKPGKH